MNLIKQKKGNILNHLLSNSGTSNFMSENEKNLILRPLSKKKIKAALLKQNDIAYSMFNSNFIKCDKERKNMRRLTSSYFYKKNDIRNEKNSNLNSEDKKPKNKYLKFRHEFLDDDNKINKMFAKFKRHISKNDLLVKWFSLIKEKGNKKSKFDKH